MKKIITLIFTGLLFMACNTDDTGSVSSITNYAVIEINGNNPEIVNPLGTTYTDQGATVTESGTPIPYTTAIFGKYRGNTTLDSNIMDEYYLTYSAVNKDGYSAGKERKVIVYQNGDLTTSIEGLYTSTVKRDGSYMSATQGSSKDMEYVYIWKNADGTFQVSDAFGGWYNLGRSIADSFTPDGLFDASFTPTGNELTNPYFGGSAVIKSLSVDPATKTLVMTTEWKADASTTYIFECTLVQTTL